MRAEPTTTVMPNSPASRRLRFYWLLMQQVSRSGQALIVDSPNGMVERVVRERGLPLNRIGSRTHLERYGLWIEPWLTDAASPETPGAIDYQPVLLGSMPVWLEYQPPIQAGLRTLPADTVRVPVESLATLIAGLRDVSFIHINDPVYLMDILEGGSDVLIRTQPLITLVVKGGNVPSPAENCLRGMGYRIFKLGSAAARGGSMDLIAAVDPVASLVQKCIDLIDLTEQPGHTGFGVGETVTRLAETEAEQTLRTFEATRSRLLTECEEKRQITFRLADLPGENWYPAESDADKRWRWSGPLAESRLLVPIPAPGNYQLTAEVFGTANEAIDGTAHVFVDGRYYPDVGKSVLPGSSFTVRFSIPAEEWTGVVDMLIALPRTCRPNPDDPRTLGVSLARLGLQWRQSDEQ